MMCWRFQVFARPAMLAARIALFGAAVSAGAVQVNWDGGGDGMNWSDPSNWDGGQMPGPDDDVTINSPGTQVRIDGSIIEVASLTTLSEVVIDAFSLTASSFIHFDADVAYLLSGDVSSPDIRAKEAVFVYWGGTLLNDVLIDDGEVVFDTGFNPATFILWGDSFIGGSIPPDVTVKIQGLSSGGHATIGLDGPVESSGTIIFESIGSNIYRTTLQTDELPFSNLTDGVIEIRNGIGGQRLIEGIFNNEGTVNVEAGQLFQVSGLFIQDGALNLGDGARLEVDGSLYNEGTTTLGLGAALAVDMQETGSFIQAEGQMLAGSDADVSFDRGVFFWDGGDLPPSVAIQDSNVSLGTNAIFPAEFQLRGDITWTGEIAKDQTLWVQGGGGSRREHAVLQFITQTKNSGTIRLESVSGSVYRSSLISSFAMLENTPDGAIVAMAGSGGDLAITTTLDNRGSFLVDTDASLDFVGDFMNQQGASAIVESGADVTFRGPFKQQGAFDVRSQSNVLIDLEGSHLFEHLSGATTVALDAIFRVVDGGAQLLQGAFGAQVLMEDMDLFLGLDLVSPCEFVMLGDSIFRGNIVEGQTLHVTGRSAEGHATLELPEPVSNSGHIILDTESGDIWRTTLNAPNGLNNLTTGVIELPLGSGGRRIFAGQLFNDGQISVSDGSRFEVLGFVSNFGGIAIGDDASFSLGGTFDNAGEVLVGARSAVGFQHGEVDGFHQMFGEFRLDPSATMLVEGGTVDMYGGVFEGEAILTDVSLLIGFEMTSPFSLILQGDCFFDGDIAAGQSIWIRGTGSIPGITGGTDTVVTSFRSFTNAGLLKLESINGDLWESSLVLGEELVHNVAGGVMEINFGDGGQRGISGIVINEGLLSFAGTEDLTSDEPVIEPEIYGALWNSGALMVGNRVSTYIEGIFVNDGVANFGEESIFIVSGGEEAGFTMSDGLVNLGETSGIGVLGTGISLLNGTINGVVAIIGSHLELNPGLSGETIFAFQGQNTFLGNLTADKTMLIQGGGQYTGHSVLVTEGRFINDGTIILEAIGSNIFRSSLIVLDGVLENNGSIVALAGTGGPKSILAELRNTGDVALEGRFTLGLAEANHLNQGDLEFVTADATVIGQSFVNDATGTFAGTGVVDFRPGRLQNLGVVSPGHSAGGLTVLGDFTQLPTGSIDIELEGNDPETGFDVLKIDGRATLAGALNVALGSEYFPTLGDDFPVLRYGSRSGSFAMVTGLNLGFGDQLFLDGFYLPRKFSLYAVDSMLAPPQINVHPIGGSLQLADVVSLFVEASGTGPLRYQWRRNGVKLEGQTGDRLTIRGLDAFAAGDYQAIVHNDFGFVASQVASIFIDGPGISALEMNDSWGQQPTFRMSQFRGFTGNTGATRDAGEPLHDGKPGGASVWLTWIPDESGVATFETTGSAFDTILAVYTGDSIGNLQRVSSDDDGSSTLTSLLKFNAIAGTPYHVVVDGYSRQQGRISLAWNLDTGVIAAPVIVTQPADAVVKVGDTAVYSVGTEGGNLFYQWFFNDAPIDGANGTQWTVSDVQTPKLGVYDVIVSNAVGDQVRSRKARLEVGSDAGARTSWKLQELLDSLGGVQAASTDVKKNAFTSVSAGAVGSQIFANFGATTEPGEPDHGGSIGGASVWFGIEVEADGILRVDTEGSDIDTTMAVYVGSSLLDLQLVAEDDDGGADGATSLVQFEAERGVEYLVAVDGVDGVTGNISLNWQLGTMLGITVQPMSQEIQVGQSFALTIAMTGEPAPSVQWQLNGLDIEGATSTTYSVDSAVEDDFGRYSVVLENFVGIAFSADARVGPELDLSGGGGPQMRIVNLSFVGGFQCAVEGPDGRTVAIEASDDLVGWTEVFSGVVSGGMLNFNDASGAAAKRFYRARLLP